MGFPQGLAKSRPLLRTTPLTTCVCNAFWKVRVSGNLIAPFLLTCGDLRNRQRIMHFAETGLDGAKVIDPCPHEDDRGRFMRAWCARQFSEHGIDFLPVQANMGFSVKKGTVRGMHFQQAPALEAKLVRCTRGSMFDVVLDLRSTSETFGRWYGTELSAKNGRMLFVPEECAHGYQTLEENTEMYYMTSVFYTPSAARGARFDDPFFNIAWPLLATVVSDQDRNWPLMTR
jgi:dTDP-4-dehydrorhamnose 3,5-epimerase